MYLPEQVYRRPGFAVPVSGVVLWLTGVQIVTLNGGKWASIHHVTI